jgi:hypothetical protein
MQYNLCGPKTIGFIICFEPETKIEKRKKRVHSSEQKLSVSSRAKNGGSQKLSLDGLSQGDDVDSCFDSKNSRFRA